MFIGMSYIMGKEVDLDIPHGLCKWYEIFFYVLPSIAIILYRNAGTEHSVVGSTARELSEICLSVFIIWFIDRVSLWPDIQGPAYLLIIFAKLLLSISVTLGIMKLTDCVARNHDRIFRLADRYKYALCFFMIYLVRLLGYTSKSPNSWPSTYYVLNYSDGFGSRFLPGQILSFFSNDGFISNRQVVIFIGIAHIILIGECALLMNGFMNSLKSGHKKAGLFILCLYISEPAGIDALWSWENAGLNEVFVLIFLALAVMLFNMISNPVVKYGSLVLLTFLIMACYQGYLFLYLPVMLCMLINEVFDKKDRSSIVGSAFVLTTTVISFVIFQFFKFINYDSAKDLAEAASSRTDMNMKLSEYVYFLEFEHPMQYHWFSFFEGNITDDTVYFMREKSFIIILLLLPIVFLFVYIWKSLFRHLGPAPILGSKYFWMLFCDCIIIIQFAITMDWGRWYIAVLTVQFFQFMYLCYKKDAGAMKILSSIERFTERHFSLCLLTILWLSGLTRVEAAPQMKLAGRLWTAFEYVLRSLHII